MKRLVTGFDVQGHRGARGRRPENTLAAFEYAIEVGVTTLELDTGITADGVVIVCHDPLINPLLCLDQHGRPVPDSPPLYLKDLTLREIQTFDCGSLNPDPVRFPEQQLVPGAIIPSLQQVFDLAEAKNPAIRYNIESKVNPLRSHETAGPIVFAETLVALIESNHLVDRATIQSFDWQVLRRVKQLNPAIGTVALVMHSPTATTLYAATGQSPFLAGNNYADFEGDMAALLRATGYIDAYSPNFETLLPESSVFLQSIEAIQQAGFAVIPWTVNEQSMMQRLINIGVDGLITDFPDVLLQLLQAQKLDGRILENQTVDDA